jgi:hypothetical protein
MDRLESSAQQAIVLSGISLDTITRLDEDIGIHRL